MGGVDSPVRAFNAVGGHAAVHRRAAGAHIEDADGNPYIDYVMSWGPLIHGHAPRGLRQGAGRGCGAGTSFGAPTELEIELARARRDADAVDRARPLRQLRHRSRDERVRVARAATSRDRIVKFEGCYHGHADAFLVKAGSGAMTLGVPTSPGVPPRAARHAARRYNDLDSVERLFDAAPRPIAAVIVEPIAGNMGVVRRATAFSRAARRSARAHGIVLIFDEVISGFRAAAGGAQQICGVRPDLTCLGKIIGGGLPVGAYGGRADLMELVAPAGPVYQAGTLSGNPLAMTAGLWSLERAVAEALRHWPARRALAAGLADAAREPASPLQVNAFGSLLTPFFTTRAVRDYQSALTADTAAMRHGSSADAGARRLPAAVAVRGVVPLGARTPSATSTDDRRRRRRSITHAGRLFGIDGFIIATSRPSDESRRRVHPDAQDRPGRQVTSFPSVAAIVPPPPIRTPSSAPFTPPMMPPMIAPTRRRPRRSGRPSPLIPSLSSACVTVPRIG